MTRKFDIRDVHKLDNPKRREALPPEETLGIFHVREGEIFADIGCGIGYFTIPAARLAGEKGKVYALDISGDMLEILNDRLRVKEIRNVLPVRTDEYDLKLPDASVTLAFSCNVIHEIDDKHAFLREVSRVLAGDGRLAIIEWGERLEDYGPPADHRLDPGELESMLDALGFNDIANFSLGRHFYGVTARKSLL